MEKNSMGKRLQKARQNKGLTQDEAVAALQRIGITTSKSYLSQLGRIVSYPQSISATIEGL